MKRGRLPKGTTITAYWDGQTWDCQLRAFNLAEQDRPEEVVEAVRGRTEGLFRTLEDLDCAFWAWFAGATDAERARLRFATEPPVPEPYPHPSGSPQPPAAPAPGTAASGGTGG